MKHFEFGITISGTGDDKESAWIDAVENFCLDCGNPPITENKDGSNADCFTIIE